MKRRAQLGGAQRRGPASEAEEDIPPTEAAGEGFVDGAGGAKEERRDDVAQTETATIPEPAKHDGLTTPSNDSHCKTL